MADMAMALGFNAIPLVTNHYDKVTNPVKRRYQKATGQAPREDPHVADCRTMEEKGYVLRKRSEVRPDEQIVDVVRHRGEVVPRRPRNNRRRSSMDDARGGGAGYDSEGSVPPRSRVRARSQGGRSRKRGSSSSSSSSSLGSSSDEKEKCKKMQRKKWITAALASVATIHAASKVYSSIESHDKRVEQVKSGEISPEEAHKKQRNARWQDAAAIGIAALGIKGAFSEWNEVSEEHKEHMEMLKKREEHHKKRLERQRRLRATQQGGYYKGRDGQWYYDGPEPQHSEVRRELDGPRNGDRKLIEAPRGRSDDDDDSYYNSRSQSRYGRDPSRARSTYTDNRSRSRYDSYYDDDYYDEYSTRAGGARSARSARTRSLYDSEF